MPFSLFVGVGIIVVLVLLFISSRFPRKKENENPRYALPYQEKVADGIWKLKNQDPVKKVLAKSPKVDLGLKESRIKDHESGYKWSVTLSSGTKFEFGEVDANTPSGRVMPVVEVKNKEGSYVRYAPTNGLSNCHSGQSEESKKDPSVKPRDDKDCLGFVTPTVKGNVISWEIANGITARYTMQKDRVKADYIVREERLMVDGQKQKFDGRIEFEISHNGELSLLPNGEISLLKEGKEVFVIPAPVVKDAKGKEIKAEYALNGKQLSIVLSKTGLENASYPIVIDPVVIDSAGIDAFSTSLGNGRHIVRDAWGNLIAVFEGGVATGDVWYKNYNSITWVEQVIGISGPGNSVAIDIDSQGNVHTLNDVAAGIDGDVGYIKLTVTRNASNLITTIAGSTELKLDDSNKAFGPSIVVANKGDGPGKEKIVAAWSMNTTGGTKRGEMRLLQYDLGDDPSVAANWKNATESLNANGSCTEGTSGFPLSTTCAGAADIVSQYAVAHTATHGVMIQIPGRPKRSPASAKFFNGTTYTDLTNALDANTGTTADISNLGTTGYLYLGDNVPFSKITVDVTNTNSTAATIGAFEYWNGASWSALSNVIDNTASATVVLSEDGSLMFNEPSDWQTTSVNSSVRYWVRYRPSVAIDASVSVAEFYVNDRNSKALMMAIGVDDSDDMGTAYIPWDEVSEAGWENNSSLAGSGWRQNALSIDTLGGNWTTFINYPLTITSDLINNTTYVSYVEDQASDVLHVKSVPNNKDVTVAGSWTDSAFPTVTEGLDIAMSLTSDGQDIYLFYILNPGTTNLVWRKCNPSGGGNPKICDNASDWGAENILVSTITLSHPQAVIGKAGGDTVAIDVIYTDTTALTVNYERQYVALADKTVTVAASSDDAVHRDCDVGPSVDDDVIDTVELVLGRNIAANIGTDCGGSGNVTYHSGIRFPNVTVPQGRAVSSAYLDMRIEVIQGNPVSFSIYGEDVNDSASYTALTDACDATCVGNRTRTTSSYSYTNWLPSTITYRLDVTDIVQEIICRGAANTQPCVGDFNGSGAWASGNALGLLLITTSVQNASDIILPVAFDNVLNTGQNPTLQINLAPVGKIYSINSETKIASGSASYVNFDHSFSSDEFNKVVADDNSFASVSASMNLNASASAQPAFMFKVNNTLNDNASKIDASTIVRSTIPATSRPIYLQVYRGGSTNNWVTMATNTTSAADTDITLTSNQINTNLSDYYFVETPGLTCTSSSANCWSYWRVYQDPASSGGSNQILSTDYINITYTAFLPPAATTDAATSVSASSATLNSTVNPNSLSTDVFYKYDTADVSCASLATTTSTSNIGSGSVDVSPNSVPISGLSNSTTYFYCAGATNSIGTTYGTKLNFSTSAGGAVGLHIGGRVKIGGGTRL